MRFSWVVLLLFPGVYLYDSNLHGGADHFAAFFALPIGLAAQRDEARSRCTHSPRCSAPAWC